jgi:iron complex outermembrane receptor protein
VPLFYKIGADVTYYPFVNQFDINHIYRVAANATDEVTTRGVAVGLNYYYGKHIMLMGNYSYNVLDRGNSVDPLIPAYNTPENKFNIGLSGRELDTPWLWYLTGFSINYKWVQGFQYEGSPQFTGYVPEYYMVDVQVNKKIPRTYCTVKFGASNILDNRKFTVYGGPTVGRMAYVSILFELTK